LASPTTSDEKSALMFQCDVPKVWMFTRMVYDPGFCAVVMSPEWTPQMHPAILPYVSCFKRDDLHRANTGVGCAARLGTTMLFRSRHLSIDPRSTASRGFCDYALLHLMYSEGETNVFRQPNQKITSINS
jgi:hypothetical protein